MSGDVIRKNSLNIAPDGCVMGIQGSRDQEVFQECIPKFRPVSKQKYLAIPPELMDSFTSSLPDFPRFLSRHHSTPIGKMPRIYEILYAGYSQAKYEGLTSPLGFMENTFKSFLEMSGLFLEPRFRATLGLPNIEGGNLSEPGDFEKLLGFLKESVSSESLSSLLPIILSELEIHIAWAPWNILVGPSPQNRVGDAAAGFDDFTGAAEYLFSLGLINSKTLERFKAIHSLYIFTERFSSSFMGPIGRTNSTLSDLQELDRSISLIHESVLDSYSRTGLLHLKEASFFWRKHEASSGYILRDLMRDFGLPFDFGLPGPLGFPKVTVDREVGKKVDEFSVSDLFPLSACSDPIVLGKSLLRDLDPGLPTPRTTPLTDFVIKPFSIKSRKIAKRPFPGDGEEDMPLYEKNKP